MDYGVFTPKQASMSRMGAYQTCFFFSFVDENLE